MIPAICFIRLKIKGKREDLELIRESLIGVDPSAEFFDPYFVNIFCFNNIIKLDHKIVKRKSQIDLSEHWIKTWNCESNAIKATLKESENEIEYKFTTLRDIPLNIFKKIVESHSNLKFELSCDIPRKSKKIKGLSHKGQLKISESRS